MLSEFIMKDSVVQQINQYSGITLSLHLTRHLIELYLLACLILLLTFVDVSFRVPAAQSVDCHSVAVQEVTSEDCHSVLKAVLCLEWWAVVLKVLFCCALFAQQIFKMTLDKQNVAMMETLHISEYNTWQECAGKELILLRMLQIWTELVWHWISVRALLSTYIEYLSFTGEGRGGEIWQTVKLGEKYFCSDWSTQKSLYFLK